ncbi:type II secretion system protein [Deinococcus oregonensis]|uniref:Type II secretion system protein n=1 Tax=Deinococcus oregonensis TaxID=1805970 RepID=A0ABV6B4U0_9DEIO
MPHQSIRAFTLLEVLLVCAIVGVLAALTPMAFDKLRAPAREGTSLTSATLKSACARAIGSTSAVRLSLNADRLGLTAETGATCAATTWTRFPSLDVTLPNKASYVNTVPWWVCFTSRGRIQTAPPALRITDTKGRSLGLTVYLGGAITEIP